MIGYVTLGTNDMDKAAAFYDALLDTLGAGRAMDPSLCLRDASISGLLGLTDLLGHHGLHGSNTAPVARRSHCP